jgi:putative transposase
MPNHVHLVLTPRDSDGIRRALAKVHKAYAGAIHACLQRMGHFWQGRFGCVAMDEAHLLAAVRYLAYNPVRARLVERPEDRRWSSARVRLGRVADDGIAGVLQTSPRFSMAARTRRTRRPCGAARRSAGPWATAPSSTLPKRSPDGR